MTTPRVERFYQQRAGRPPIASQHSSSVPSTPHQQPRDIRFPSRSPSPSRALGSHSPHSVVSEAPGVQTVRRPEIGCIFEKAPDYRKRRIPYKDGGNEPLPRPEKEPKRSLEPDEDDRLSGDMRELYDRLLPSVESEERRVRLVQKLQKILDVRWPNNDITVNVFGSSGNLLSSDDSDVDICLTTSLKELEKMHSLATELSANGMKDVKCRAFAKVPIVKFWDPELELACDMNVNNPLALENTRMIKTYVQLDDRVRPLAKIIKYWTKRRILNDAAFGGTISSYTWICMIINFLQTRDPKILPSLQKLPDSRRPSTNGQQSSFADDVEQIRGSGSDNKESLGQLLFGFFRYYGYELDYAESIVSVKEGRLMARKEKGWDVGNYHDKEAQKRLCVEEPFNTSRNLGNSADDYAFSGIHEEIRRAFDLIARVELEACCEQYEFPPDEKPVFQRPKPQPKPTLTRSASQQGRPHATSVGAKPGGSSRTSRNTSSHRNNSRRASSGAAYGQQQRFAYLQSPSLGMGSSDYFGAQGLSTDQLHEQLYKQYQYLQAQQEALRSQLLQQNQVQLQAQAQVQAQAQAFRAHNMDFSSSPRQRTMVNGMHSSRTLENSPITAPLLPGYLYHYPARYPPASPLSHTRMQDGSTTNPPSPSSATASMGMRRPAHRASMPEPTSTPAVRSQSQPGRSYPSPATLQSLAHPGYDVSGAIGAPYMLPQTMQMLQAQANGIDMSHMRSNGPSHTETVPKEYVGYYLGQSPQLRPQYPIMNPPFTPVLRDAQRRLTRDPSPELLPPILPNGMRRHSRSPSPLGRQRHSSTASNHTAVPSPLNPFPDALGLPVRSLDDGPVIVNGSTPVPISQPSSVLQAERSAPLNGLSLDTSDGTLLGLDTDSISSTQTPSVDASKTYDPEQPLVLNGSTPLTSTTPAHLSAQDSTSTPVTANALSALDDSSQVSEASSPRIAPNHRARAPARLNLSPSLETRADVTATSTEQVVDSSPLVTAPILSPVVEMRTPSPTSSRGLGSPQPSMQSLAKSVATANGRLSKITSDTRSQPGHLSPPNGTATMTQDAQADTNGKATAVLASTPTLQSNVWQQATRKGHKKSKSSSGSKTGILNGNKVGGELLPENEADRKGG